ncbi:MAG TPA: protease inhibitor I42 family protein [Acidobacteriaceae bacterium]
MKTSLGFRTLPLALSMMMAVVGAQSEQHRTIQIGEFTQPVQISLQVGDTLHIVLSATPSTGYSWHVVSSTSSLKAMSSSNTPGAPRRPGAAGTQTLVLKAVSPGKDNLVLDYTRPWEKGKPAARQYTVAVSVGDGAATPVSIRGSTPLGIYSGKLPCADCSGIQTSIALYAENSAQSPIGYYVRTSEYLGRPTIFIEAGHLQLQRGTPDDPNQTIYSLKSNTSDHLESYLLQGDMLVPLDTEGKPIQAPFNLSLKRQP